MQVKSKQFFLAGVAGLIAFLGFMMMLANISYAEGSGEGEELFKANCMGCHSLGGGNGIGPDLMGITEIRDRDWLKQFILDPQAMVDSGDETAVALVDEYGMVMPKVGLGNSEADSLVAYLEAISTQGSGSAPGAGTSGGMTGSQVGEGQFPLSSFAFYGVIGSFILFGIMDAIWFGRLRGVRKSLK